MTDPATILIVDDNPENLSVLFDILKAESYQVLIAQTGYIALEVLNKVIPDVILLDIRMEGLDGFETCRQIKANPKTQDIPVLFISALSELQDKITGFKAGAVDYITKPFQHEEVLVRVQTHITNRKLVKELQEKNKQLDELNASKDRFFGLIAHDLRNPLQSLLYFTEQLREKISLLDDTHKPVFDDLHQLILQNSTSLYLLIENLVEWVKIQLNHIQFHPKRSNLVVLAHRCVASLADSLSNKAIQVEMDFPKHLYAEVDEEMMLLVFWNVITNAIKFSHPDSKIQFSLKEEGDQIVIEVLDEGVGIPPSIQESLFRIDKKIATAGTQGEQGTGLGLLITGEYIHRHGGTLELVAQKPHGTCVTIYIPQTKDRE